MKRMVTMISILAAADMLQWVHLAITVALTIGMAYVASNQRDMKDMRSEVKGAAEKLIDERFAAFEQRCDLKCGDDLKQLIAVLSERIRQINERLAKGDADFDRLGDRGQGIELKLMAEITKIRETCATKNDLDKINDRFTHFEHAIARMQVEHERKGRAA